MTKFAKIVAAALATLCLTAGSASADLILNGGFETGDFTAWTQGGNTTSTGVNSFFAHSGSNGAFFGPMFSVTTLSQTLATGVGEIYDISFWLANTYGGNSNSYSASFDGVTLASATDAPAFGYTYFDFQVVASTTSTVLQFGFRHDADFYSLDDVSVRSVPEPNSALLVGLGVTILAVWSRRRSKGRVTAAA